MTRCDFRTHRECRCKPGQCQQQQLAYDLGRFKKTTPTRYGPSLLETCITTAALVSLLIGGAMMAEGYQARKDLIEQESKSIMRASR